MIEALRTRFGLASGRDTANLESRIWGYGVPAVVALAAWLYGLVTLWFTDFPPGSDDQGLFNPAYVFLKTGHMAYPIYPATDSAQTMYVHPPVHYAVLATVMRLTGATVESAVLMIVLFWLGLGLALIVASRMSSAAKLAFIVGSTATIVAWAVPYFVRPELDIVGAWLCGIFALETGRRRSWNPWLLGLGALLLSLAATMHYPMAGIVAGPAVYACWAVLDRRRAAIRPVLAIALGAVAVLAPYAALFVIPDWHLIQQVTHTVQNQPGTHSPFVQEGLTYQWLYAWGDGGPFLNAVIGPFLRFGIPVVFVVAPFLIARRDTRGIALGTLPQLLFFLFYVRWKLPGANNYFLIEVTLYYSSVVYALLLVVRALLLRAPRRLRRPAPAVALAGAACLVAVVVFARPEIQRNGIRDWHPQHAAMEIARAATGTLLPPNALILNSAELTLWYMTGAGQSYPLWRDLTFQPDLSKVNVPAYLAGFTAVAEGPNEAGEDLAAYNKQHEGAPNWIVHGILKPYRFYLGELYNTSSAALRYVLFSTQQRPLAGSTADGHSLYRYQEARSGAFTYVTEVCPAQSQFVTTLDVPERTLIYLPLTTAGSTKPVTTIVVYVATQDLVRHKLAPLAAASRCRRLDAIPLARTTVTVSSVLRRWQAMGGDRTIRFPTFVPATNALHDPTIPTVIEPHPVLSDTQLLNTGPPRPGASATVFAAKDVQAPMLSVSLPRQRPRESWVELDGSVLTGPLSYCVYDTVKHACVSQWNLPTGAHGRFFIQVPATADPVSLFVLNQSGGDGRLVVRALSLHVPATPSRPGHCGASRCG